MASSSDTIVFVGSGAVSGAWSPVIQALQRKRFPDVATVGGANFAMSRLVYTGRQIWRWARGEKHRKLRQEFRETLLDVKRSIASALTEAVAAGSISIRAEFGSVMREIALKDTERVAVVTTNWEGTVEAAVDVFKLGLGVRYLHGSARDPEHMYLPTEIVEEPYRKRRVRDELSDRRREVVDGIGTASRLVLYGLALSPLDAELGQILASAMTGGRVSAIHIVDPQYPLVAERVAGLLDETSATRTAIYGMPPGDLARQWRFERGRLEAECSRLGLSA